MSCCPSSGWGELKNTSYKPKGIIDEVGDLKLYRVGQSTKCIIWNYDVFGLDGGRTKQMADFLADNGESNLELIMNYSVLQKNLLISNK